MTDSFKMWVEPKPRCPNCGAEGIKVNRELCLECGAVFRDMAEKQMEQVKVGKELANALLFVRETGPWDAILQKARDCGLLDV